MKVFSLEKFKKGLHGQQVDSWAYQCDGKTREECEALGWVVCDSWMVEPSPTQDDTATIKGAKLEYHRLPPEQLAGMAEIMNKGEISHVTGYMEINPRHYWNAIFGHLMAIRRGERLDEEGNSHALAIACNGVILDRQLKAGKELRFEK